MGSNNYSATANACASESYSVPDGLMAMSKDARYVRDCKALLFSLLSSLMPRRRHQLEQESWILASLLCFSMGLKRTPNSTTLGMETCGLAYSFSFESSSRWKWFLSTAAALSWAFSSAGTAVIGGNDSSNSNYRRYSDSNANLHSLNIIGVDPHFNGEMLRGPSRREFYERQRSEMLLRANLAASNQQSSNKCRLTLYNDNDTDVNRARNSPSLLLQGEGSGSPISSRQTQTTIFTQRRSAELPVGLRQMIKDFLLILAPVRLCKPHVLYLQ